MVTANTTAFEPIKEATVDDEDCSFSTVGTELSSVIVMPPVQKPVQPNVNLSGK